MRPLAEYPWEKLKPYRKLAAESGHSVVDLSIGTPIDPTPELVRQTLKNHADAHGYPPAEGSTEVREAVAGWFARVRGVPGLSAKHVVATVGSKECVAWLPTMLGLSGTDLVIHPETAYPTYAVGADFADVDALASDAPWELPAAVQQRLKLIWINSPANPTGEVLEVAQLRQWVDFARQCGAVLAADECYAQLGWQPQLPQTPSVLDPRVCDGDFSGLLAVYSLSKQSNMAGYRAAFVAGDAELVSQLSNLRKHAGMMVPAPVQAAMVTALGDDTHVAEQKERYRQRRQQLLDALATTSMEVVASEAGLYLWVRDPGADCWDLVERFARCGIVIGPGEFYGPGAAEFVRLSLTASDADIAEAVRRITSDV